LPNTICEGYVKGDRQTRQITNPKSKSTEKDFQIQNTNLTAGSSTREQASRPNSLTEAAIGENV